MRLIPLSWVCPPITELSGQRYDWAYEGMRPLKTTTVLYDWYLLNNRYIKDKYTLTLRNKFDVLQEILETPTPNDEYENFVNAHLEAAAECIPTKQSVKPRIPWKPLAVRKKRGDV